MSACGKLLRLFAALCCVALPAAATGNDSVEIYESISDAAIGPVFLTQAQREWLDRRRLLPPEPAVANNQSAVTGEKPVANKPAGYIVSSSGRRSDWSNGDFIANTDKNQANTAFPGEVDLVIRRALYHSIQAECGRGDRVVAGYDG